MKVLRATVLLGLLVSLGGCYYDPGYSYVRGNGYGGDAYYGNGGVVYDDGYAPGYGYYDPGYGYYSSGAVIGGVWYRDRWDGRGDRGRWHDHGPRPDPGHGRPPGQGGRPGWGPRPGQGEGGPGHGWGGGARPPGDGGAGHGWGGGRPGAGAGHGPGGGRPPGGGQHSPPPRPSSGRPHTRGNER